MRVAHTPALSLFPGETMMQTKVPHDRGLTWTTNPPSEGQLRKAGYTVVHFGDIRSRFIRPSREITATRVTLDNAAVSLLRLLDDNPRLAVLGVPANTRGDLSDIYSYLVEPAFRRDVDLLLGVDHELEDLDASALVAPNMGYPWTLERLHFIARRYHRQSSEDGLPPLTPIEGQLLTAMKSAGLMPQVQYGIDRFRVDFAFVPERLVVEADGRAWHDAERDAARDAHLMTLGWTTIRFTGSQIYRDVDTVIADVVEVLATQAASLRYTPTPPAPQKTSLWRRLMNWAHGRRTATVGSPQPPLPAIERDIPSWKANLDRDQRRAVDSMEGVVQVIAPAGSGKTTTMIARVQELLSRGVPANRILCTTFNTATREELKERLKELEIADVAVRNFHALGRLILKDEGHLRADIGTISYPQWRRLARIAMDTTNGVWLDAHVASDVVSDYKLAQMLTPEQAVARAKTSSERTAAEIYRLYENHLAEASRNDFDDLIISSVRLLQQDPEARRRWQDRWECILVDEYQDIEPAQELLIQLIAAPEDSLFAVGDEDQCIYAWRRATVERIVMLDTVYPGLERTVLSTSYRCPPRITDAARTLIENNKRRFHKPIHSNPKATDDGSIELIEATNAHEGAAKVTALLAEAADPDDIVVLARTSLLLRDVVEACVSAGVQVNAPKKAMRPTDAETTVLAYLRLLASPPAARNGDVRDALRVPNRYLPDGAEESVVAALKTGATFIAAMQTIELPAGLQYGRTPQTAWGQLMDSLASSTDASRIVQELRTRGGLDKHYASVEQMSPNDQTEVAALDDLQSAATGKPPAEVVASIELKAAVLAAAADGEGIELSTIHGAKGREWDTVILYGADDDQMPHFRSLAEAKNAGELSNAIEDERRLAYVAITRTKRDLIVVTTGKPSPFLAESAISLSAGSLPTFADVQRKMEAGGTLTDGAAAWLRSASTVPNHKPSQRTSIPAKFAGVCTTCNRPIRIGAPIVNANDIWVHQQC